MVHEGKDLNFEVQILTNQLRQGDDGPVVEAMQYLLRREIEQITHDDDPQPFTPLVVDGIFGPKTDEQLKYYQSFRGLTADGIAGRLTWTQLLQDTAMGVNAG